VLAAPIAGLGVPGVASGLLGWHLSVVVVVVVSVVGIPVLSRIGRRGHSGVTSAAFPCDCGDVCLSLFFGLLSVLWRMLLLVGLVVVVVVFCAC